MYTPFHSMIEIDSFRNFSQHLKFYLRTFLWLFSVICQSNNFEQNALNLFFWNSSQCQCNLSNPHLFFLLINGRIISWLIIPDHLGIVKYQQHFKGPNLWNILHLFFLFIKVISIILPQYDVQFNWVWNFLPILI